MTPFERMLEVAAIHERALGRLVVERRGGRVVNTAAISEGGAPSARGAEDALVLPDLQVFRAGRLRWVELKCKRQAAFNRRTSQRVTGFPVRLWESYTAVEQEMGGEFFVVFAHEKEDELRCASAKVLRTCWVENGTYRGERMAYFAYDRITRVCGLEELLAHMSSADLARLAALGVYTQRRIDFAGVTP